MKLSNYFVKSSTSVNTDSESINAKYLTQAGYIKQEIAGVYSYLPLGLKVLNKVENIVREEMDKISYEILMPSLSSTESWKKSGRLESLDTLFEAQGANKLSKERNSTQYILNPTHEELVTPLVQNFAASYKDLPVKVYQIQNKFRNEARSKSGLLRGREFRMKDLYSFHASEEDLLKFYKEIQTNYLNVYEKLGLGDDTYMTLASGGDFTNEYSMEFQTLLESGEDIIYLDRENNIAYNKEIVTEEDGRKLGVNFDKFEQVKASEVGNIFPLNTKFSKAFEYYYTDENNQKQIIYMGCYGIGTSRLVGVIAEKFADDKGLVWPESVAPYKYHIITLHGDNTHKISEKVYETLGAENCIWDDRDDKSTGQKFTNADLLGIPVQIVVSNKTLEEDSVEVRSRSGKFDTYMLKIAEVGKLNS